MAVVACKAPPPEDPNAVDWTSYEQAKAPPAPPPPPPSQAPPKRTPKKRPREIGVVRHEKPPAGYTEVHRKPNWTMVAVGYSVALVTYGAPALVASQLEGNAWTMTVPVIGPILQMGATVEHFQEQGCCDLLQAFGVAYYFIFLGVLSIGQGGGLALGTVGLFTKEKRWIRSDLALVQTPSLDLRLRLSGSGLQLNGSF